MMKGTNCGIGGEALNLPTKGKCEFNLSGKGPRPFCSCLFCSSKQVHSLVPVKQGRKVLVDFSTDFQITMWVKSNSKCVKHETLIGSVPVSATTFFFYPSTNCDQLALGLSSDTTEYAYTTVDDTDRNDWRHLTVVFNPPNHVTFYRNGILWPLKQEMQANPKFVTSTHISVFANAKDDQAFTGHLAVVSIMQRKTKSRVV